jgi:hypothetical protein
LVTAWLASDTAEDTVLSTYENVTLPQIGILRVQARTCGTVYMIRNNAGLYEWKQMDVDVLHPSRSIPDDTAYETVDRALVPPPAWDGIIPVVAIDAIGTSVSEGALTGAGNILQPPAYSAASNTFKPWAVVLSQPTNRPITVKLTVLPASTASQGVDYVMPSNTFVIPPGRKEFRIGQLSLIQDSLKEGRERIEVQLEAVTGCTLGSLVNGAVSANGTNFTARCDIEDDDKPMIMVTKAADPATESGTIAKFKITVAPIVAQDTPVSFTMSGTATPTLNGTQVITGPNGEVSFASSNGADYFLLTSPYDTTVPPQTSVVIPAGQRTAEVSVIPTRDALAGEGAETITMTIDRTDPTNYDYRYSQSATVSITEP